MAYSLCWGPIGCNMFDICGGGGRGQKVRLMKQKWNYFHLLFLSIHLTLSEKSICPNPRILHFTKHEQYQILLLITVNKSKILASNYPALFWTGQSALLALMELPDLISRWRLDTVRGALLQIEVQIEVQFAGSWEIRLYHGGSFFCIRGPCNGPFFFR